MFAVADDDDLPPGLVDPDAPDADAQRELVTYLLSRGIPVAELRAARAEGGVAHFVADAALWPDPSRATVTELAARTGLDVEVARRARRVLGLADAGDDAQYHTREADYLAAFAAGAAIFGEELTLQFARVLGMSAAAIAEAATNLFAGQVAAELAARGATDAELGLTARDAMLAFEAVTVAADVALRLQFELATARLNGEVAVDELTYAIAFVDVVDSTTMAGELTGTEVASALRDFDRISAEAATRHDVRLVKLIGDGAMLAARDVAPLANGVAVIVAHVAEHPVLKAAKAGLTLGPVAAHDGDYFGQTVNLAARASTAAMPGEVLLDAAAAHALPGRTEPAGDYDLKGFSDPVPLYRLVPPEA
jgi:class 3 adenylate cyclase